LALEKLSMKITSTTTFTTLVLILAGCPEPTPSDPDTSTGDTTSAESTSTTAVADVSTSPSTDSTTAPTDDTTGSTSLPADGTTATPDDTSSTGSESTDSTTDDDTGPPPTGGYGDCTGGNMAACEPYEGCLDGGPLAVCSAGGCNDASDCPISDLPEAIPPHPLPAEVTCIDVSGEGTNDCVLDCSTALSASCPEGMTCGNVGNVAICLWPEAPAGDGVCPDLDLGSRVPQTFVGANAGFGDDHYRTCGFLGGEDLMLQWTAPTDGTFVFDTTGSSFDTVLGVLDGCAGPEIGCNDDSVGLTSQVALMMVAGQSVILVIDGYQGATGDVVLNITEP
jgi:hypothetical protein